ncbi:hypothetical protein AB0M36_22395 [Actinoplanes sp. NPDC051346]|uniref:hypothetical protein n=1 Tax=Actinoplanes sp. NPDC051346 TaxID=3155048 RepID=UPI00343B7224
MTEERAGVRMRRAYVALACWYAAVWLAPAVLATLINISNVGDTPGYTEVQGRVTRCVGEFGCPSEPIGLGGVLLWTAMVLAPSLLMAVPLCVRLARKWEMPILAGSVAAVTSWMTFCLGFWLIQEVWAG